MRGGRAGGEGVPDTGSLHKPVESESLAHSRQLEEVHCGWNGVRNGDGEVHRSDLERLYIRFKEAEISNQLTAHRKGREKR